MNTRVYISGKRQVLRNADHLQSIINGKVSLIHCKSVDLQFHQLGPKELQLWTKRINQNLPACGCLTSAVFASMSFLFFVYYYASINKYEMLAANWPVILMVIMISGLTGKILGSWYQRHKVKRMASELLSALKESGINRYAVYPPAAIE